MPDAILPHPIFCDLTCRPEEELDLARAAFPIYPDLVEKIDTFAARVERRAGAEADTFRLLATMNLVLFTEEGFRGNSDDYYDPRNSFLNEVLDRKTGIPITLPVLYMEVARRAGLSLQSVGFPGHFLVKCPAKDAEDELIIDPFRQGEVTPADYRNCLAALERLLILDPDSPLEIHDRSLVYLRLECFSQALADLERYLRAGPGAGDAETVREQMLRLQRLIEGMH